MMTNILDNITKIYLYGAGGVAKDVYKFLESNSQKYQISVVVSEKKDEEDFLGKPIYKFDDILPSIVWDYSVVIIAMVRTTALLVHEMLLKKGIEENKIITIEQLRDGIYSANEVNKNKIIFSNFNGNGYGCNPKYICEKLKNYNYDLVWACRNIDEYVPFYVRKVEYGTAEYYSELSTAKIWVDNTHKSILAQKRKGQYYIQTWHGCGPIKKIEYDAEQLPQSYLESVDYDMSMVDLCVSGASFCTEQYRRAFHYDGEVMECGCPRNDIFFGITDHKKKVSPSNATKKWILYAPTLRNGESTLIDTEMILRACKEYFHEDCILLIREHPQMKLKTGRYVFDDRVINMCDHPDIQELLAASDLLITDYSSVMWDFSLQYKPVFLYQPDQLDYDEERGFYLSFDSFPYPFAESLEKLAKGIIEFDERKYRINLQQFLLKYGCFDVGQASQKVADRIVSIIEGGMDET